MESLGPKLCGRLIGKTCRSTKAQTCSKDK